MLGSARNPKLLVMGVREESNQELTDRKIDM